MRVAALDAVARAKVAPLADAAAGRLGDAVPVKAAALRALAATKATAHATAVVKLLKDVHPTVRREATLALPDVLGAADAQARAIEMLADPDETVRTSAASALARTPGPATVAPLVKALSDPYTPLHEATRAALVAAKDASVPASVNLLDDADPRRREDGSYVLGLLASHEGHDRHVALLDDADWGVVAQAARSLGPIGDASAGPALARTARRAQAKSTKISAAESDANPSIATDVTNAAVNSIVSAAQVGHAPIGAVVAPWIPDKNSCATPIRAAGFWAVGIVGAPDEAAIFGRVPGMVGDLMEGGDVKIEGLKAIGNRKFAAGKSLLQGSVSIYPFGQMLAIIHWSQDRIDGKVTPFELPPESWTANVSVSDHAEP
jgi:hypothetical protein